MKAKIDLEKFICSYVKWNNIQDALKDQGLKCWNGKIIEIPQENEDEKIRKELISFVGHDGWKFIKEEKESWIDLLEKQDKSIDKEKVLIGVRKDIALSIMNFLYMNIPGMCISNIECKDLEDAVVNSDWLKVYEYMKKKLESKGEQKLINKFEPKFSVGDWVVFIAAGSVYQVEEIKNYEYTLRHILDGSFRMWLSFSDEKFIREWTIQDAKDGDVVVDKSDGTIGLFQSIGHHPDGGSYNDPSYCFLHCRYDDGFFYADFENGNTMDSDDVIPATKEQRDLLFKKMKDAGYEWDAEKKELKKLEQRFNDRIDPLIKEEIDLWIKENSDIHHDNNDIVELIRDMGYYVATLTRNLYRQKPSWNEKDEKLVKDIIAAIDTLYYHGMVNWLKSLKDRVQPQNMWKPSKEQIIALRWILNNIPYNKHKEEISGLLDQIKDL